VLRWRGVERLASSLTVGSETLDIYTAAFIGWFSLFGESQTSRGAEILLQCVCPHNQIFVFRKVERIENDACEGCTQMHLTEWRSWATCCAKAVLIRPSAEQGSLRSGWEHVVQRGLVFKTTDTYTHYTSSEMVEEVLLHSQKTKNIQTDKTKKYVSEHTAFPKPTPVTTKGQMGKGTKPKVENSKSTKFVVPPHRTQSPLEGIFNFLGNLPLQACG
jgi:hypothetical protein